MRNTEFNNSFFFDNFCYWFESVKFHFYCEISNSVKFITVVLALQNSNFCLRKHVLIFFLTFR
jgi:hypothetical protein